MNRPFFKKAFLITAILLCAVILVNLSLKFFISKNISSLTGTKVTIRSLIWNIFTSRFAFKDLKAYNPDGFPSEPFLDIALMEASYSLQQLRLDEPVLDKLTINVKEIAVVKLEDKTVNINELKMVKEAAKGDPMLPVLPLEVKELHLNIDKLIHKDFTREEQPLIKAYDIGLKDKKFKNVKSGRKVVALVIANSVGKTSLKGIKLYALAAFLGPAALPASVSGLLVGKDGAKAELSLPVERVFEASLKVLNDIGEVKRENAEASKIDAAVSGHDVNVKMKVSDEGKVHLDVSARKLAVPKPEFAGGILYQIEKELE